MTEKQHAPTAEMGEPTWEIAHLFPRQGTWSEEEYLALPTNRLVEFSDGHIEVLPMPTQSHQLIVAFLYRKLLMFLERHLPGAVVLFAPLPVLLWPGKYREPDLAVMLAEHADRRHEKYWEPPDLVIEVVSPENRQHDLEVKRQEYARAGIPEYWIVDPQTQRITVLTLKEDKYTVYGQFGPGTVARSHVLPGFEVAVDEVWAAARQ